MQTLLRRKLLSCENSVVENNMLHCLLRSVHIHMHDTALPGICDNGLPSTKGNRIMHNKTYLKCWQHCWKNKKGKESRLKVCALCHKYMRCVLCSILIRRN